MTFLMPMNARTKQFVATVLLICHWGALTHSQAPEWWLTRQARILNALPDDYALINQGQLKQLAYAAYQEMEEKLVGGAGPQISALVQSWLAPGGAGRDDYAVANIGQLKALASVFHARLQEVGLGVPYTWTADTSDDADFAPANIGQAKALFAFQLSAGTAIWSGEFQTYKEAYGGLFDEESPFVLHYLDWRCNQVQTHIGETRTLGWTETWQWQLLNGPLNWPEWVKASTHYEALPDGMAPQQWATRYYDPTPYFIKRSVLLEQHHDFVAAPSLLTSIDEYEVQEVFWWPGVRLDLNLDLKQTWLVHDAETGAPVWDSLYPNVSLNDKLASQHGYQYEVTTQTYRESYSDEVTALLPGAPLGQVPPHGLTQSASGPLTNPANGWSPAALTPVDAPLQALASGGETIPFEPMRLPSTGGVMATAKTELEKRPMHHLPEGGQPQLLDRWQGIHCQGKVALAWRTDISDALTPAVMQNWIDRFQVLIEETVSPADGSPPVTTSTSRPLADFLQASDAGPQVIGELNAGSLSGMVDDLNREVRLSLVCSVPALASPFASTGGGTAGGTSGGAGQNGSSDPNPSFVLHMEMPTLEAYVGGREYTLDPPLQSATYSHSAVKRSSKDPQFDYASNLPARLRLSEFPAEIEHLPPLQVDAIGDQIGYLWPFKPDVDDPLMLIGERSFPAFDTCSIPFDNFILVALSSKNTFQDIAYDAGAEDLEIGTFEDTTRYEARTRFRLRAKAPLMLGGQPVNLPQGYRATFLPVVEVRNLLAWGGESDPVETHVLPTLEMEIPPGDSASAIRNVDTLPQLSQHLPAQPNTVVRLRLIPIEFKGNKKNLTTRLDQFPEPIGGLENREYDSVFPDSDQHHLWNKVTCVLWSASPGKIDLIDHVQGADRATLEAAVEWQVNGNTQTSSEISMGSKPYTDSYRPFYVKIVPKGGGKVIDRLIITLVPPETKANFDAWYATESTAAGKAWFAELPPIPSSLEVAPSLLAPDRNYPIAARLYYDPSTTATYMHPDARFELRSRPTAGGHAHQVCFTSSGGLILSGVSAGSADKAASFHFPDVTDPQPHVDADVTPFVWSLQLDGNPCNRPPLSATLSKPMLHQGTNLDKYFECRPAEPNGKPRFAPGSTP